MTSGRPFPSDFFVDSIICSLCLPKYHFLDTNFAELVVYKQNKTKQNQKKQTLRDTWHGKIVPGKRAKLGCLYEENLHRLPG